MNFETKAPHSQSARRVIRGARRNLLAMSAINRAYQAEMARRARWRPSRFGWHGIRPGTCRLQYEGCTEGHNDGGEGEPG
jgi:hypothetical protein